MVVPIAERPRAGRTTALRFGLGNALLVRLSAPPIEQANVTITDVTYAQAGLDPKPSLSIHSSSKRKSRAIITVHWLSLPIITYPNELAIGLLSLQNKKRSLWAPPLLLPFFRL